MSLRSRFMTWMTRLYLARVSKKGFDLSKVAGSRYRNCRFRSV